MLKGIKKRLHSTRLGGSRSKKGQGASMPPCEPSPREPPDRGGSKPTSPRQVHPVRRAPLVRCSMERSRTAPTKSKPADSLPVMPLTAYRTTPNICVTGGKIEFVASEGRGESGASSSHASSQRSSSPEVPSAKSSPKKETAPVSLKRNDSDYEVSLNTISDETKKTEMTEFSCISTLNEEVHTNVNELLRENWEVKQKLSSLQSEFTRLQDKVSQLMEQQQNSLSVKKVEESSLDNCLSVFKSNILEEKCDSEIQTKVLAERCNALETLNRRLQAEAEMLHQQYGHCLDRVASQVVQAILVQKSQQEQCEKLSKEVDDLRKKNKALSSIVGAKVVSTSVSNSTHPRCRARYSCPIVDHDNFYSLPGKLRQTVVSENGTKKSIYNDSQVHIKSESIAKCNSSNNSRISFLNSKKNNVCTEANNSPSCWYDVVKGNRNNEVLTIAASSESSIDDKLPITSQYSSINHQDCIVASTPKRYSQNEKENPSICVSPLQTIEKVNATKSNAIVLVDIKKVVNLDHGETHNKNIKFSPEENSGESNTSGTSSGAEGTTKDEGYSTMSSDVQAEVKESETIQSFSTVLEEFGSPVESESSCICQSPVELLTSPSMTSGAKSVKKMNPFTQVQLREELRVYDEEDTNSDVFFVPIHSFRHTFHFPSSKEEDISLIRCSSDSQIIKDISKSSSIIKYPRELSISFLNMQKDITNGRNNNNLKRTVGQSSLKQEQECKIKKSEKFLDGFQQEVWGETESRVLSPSYSPAEMEDWSLDLSGEEMPSVCGDSDRSFCDISTSSAQEATTADLEEDSSEFLWNGASYLKADDVIQWSCEDNRIAEMKNISPKSGCSDQPAMWSSSEHLSCCSEVASKSSTDIENFCEQLCNLPELKRVSFCSSEISANDLLIKSSDTGSFEDQCEVEANVDTVFTRDFYRLVKFESNKSLAASSKSLVGSEGLLTLEKLRSLDSGETCEEALISVLDFIAEQQKYCKEREALDDKVVHINDVFSSENISKCDSYFCDSKNFTIHTDTSKTKMVKSFQENNFVPPLCPRRSTSLHSEVAVTKESRLYQSYTPVLPIRSTSHSSGLTSSHSSSLSTILSQDENSDSNSTKPVFSSAGSKTICHSSFTKPVFFSGSKTIDNYSPPVLPRRSTSHSSATFKAHCNTIPVQLPPPKVPPHSPIVSIRSSSLSGPPVPNRCSSKLTEERTHILSPPVPKRVTSRALPHPPAGELSLPPPHSSSLKPPAPRKRPHSLVKEMYASMKQQTKGNKVSANYRNSASFLIELQKMAAAEEEEQGYSQPCSVQPTTPEDESGLGTGWMHVEPTVDLKDPKVRANLLDGMLPSSEPCSSETDEEFKVHQHAQLLKAIQRNRRRKKVSQRNDAYAVVGASAASRPSIINSADMYIRFGKKEQEALQEFEFLSHYSTSETDSEAASHREAMLYSEQAFVNSSCKSISPKVEKKKYINNPVGVNSAVKAAANSHVQTKKHNSNQSCVDTSSLCNVKKTIHQFNVSNSSNKRRLSSFNSKDQVKRNNLKKNSNGKFFKSSSAAIVSNPKLTPRTPGSRIPLPTVVNHSDRLIKESSVKRDRNYLSKLPSNKPKRGNSLQSCKTVNASPRLVRLQQRAKERDNLGAFSGQPLCDSGSSECSEKGALSFSDSCAENFESGDENNQTVYKS